MSRGRVLSSAAASLAVGACAVLAIGMSQAAREPAADRPSTTATPVHTARPAFLAPSTTEPTHAPAAQLAGASTAAVPARPIRTATQIPTSAVTSGPAPVSVTSPSARTAQPTAARPMRPVEKSALAAARPVTHRVLRGSTPAARGQALPLHSSTGSASRVITVVARSKSRTTATLQAWTKASGGGWRKYDSSVTAHVGADGLSTHPSESRSATPIGSFTLTQAFGHYSDPGTPLPYLHTRTSDWWISQPGQLYNTHQRCSSHCSFDTRNSVRNPNEHLYYETPFYNYAVVIDYNTRNAPGGVRQGAGSAFFLHVTDGSATAGCISIPQTKLVSLMRWLTPSAHPRILIGTL